MFKKQLTTNLNNAELNFGQASAIDELMVQLADTFLKQNIPWTDILPDKTISRELIGRIFTQSSFNTEELKYICELVLKDGQAESQLAVHLTNLDIISAKKKEIVQNLKNLADRYEENWKICVSQNSYFNRDFLRWIDRLKISFPYRVRHYTVAVRLNEAFATALSIMRNVINILLINKPADIEHKYKEADYLPISQRRGNLMVYEKIDGVEGHFFVNQSSLRKIYDAVSTSLQTAEHAIDLWNLQFNKPVLLKAQKIIIIKGLTYLFKTAQTLTVYDLHKLFDCLSILNTEHFGQDKQINDLLETIWQNDSFIRQQIKAELDTIRKITARRLSQSLPVAAKKSRKTEEGQAEQLAIIPRVLSLLPNLPKEKRNSGVLLNSLLTVAILIKNQEKELSQQIIDAFLAYHTRYLEGIVSSLENIRCQYNVSFSYTSSQTKEEKDKIAEFERFKTGLLDKLKTTRLASLNDLLSLLPRLRDLLFFLNSADNVFLIQNNLNESNKDDEFFASKVLTYVSALLRSLDINTNFNRFELSPIEMENIELLKAEAKKTRDLLKLSRSAYYPHSKKTLEFFRSLLELNSWAPLIVEKTADGDLLIINPATRQKKSLLHSNYRKLLFTEKYQGRFYINPLKNILEFVDRALLDNIKDSLENNEQITLWPAERNNGQDQETIIVAAGNLLN